MMMLLLMMMIIIIIIMMLSVRSLIIILKMIILKRLMDTHAHTLCPSGILFYSYVRTLGELRQIDQPESASMRIGRATEEAPWVSLLGPRFVIILDIYLFFAYI